MKKIAHLSICTGFNNIINCFGVQMKKKMKRMMTVKKLPAKTKEEAEELLQHYDARYQLIEKNGKYYVRILTY